MARMGGRTIEDPPIAHFLFADTRFAPVWLVVRLWMGYEWFTSGWAKLGNPAWMEGGGALRGFWARAVDIPEGERPPITFDWYREFLVFLLETESYTWFAPLIVAGELLVGAALILGLLTGIAAFLGSFMNFNFMLAGTASANPLMFAFAVLLVLAWKTAGYWGLDRWLLPLLGTPWQPGTLFGRKEPARPDDYREGT